MHWAVMSLLKRKGAFSNNVRKFSKISHQKSASKNDLLLAIFGPKNAGFSAKFSAILDQIGTVVLEII